MLEGGEGCGKDTQAKLLKEYFDSKKIPCTITKEPGGTPVAEEISKILKDKKNDLSPNTELFLFQAAREDNYRNVIFPFLNTDKMQVLIKTRGWPSSIAYQGFGGKLNIDYIEELNKKTTKGWLPDLLFIIDIDPKKGLEKEVAPDRFATKGEKYHQEVRRGYLWVARNYSDISVVIPYSEGIKNMQQEIIGIIHKRLNL